MDYTEKVLNEADEDLAKAETVLTEAQDGLDALRPQQVS